MREINAVAHEANHNCSFRNCYLSRVKDPSLPENHPINIFEDTSNWILAYDQLPDTSPLKTLYHWDPVREFIAEIVGEERLYDNEDPYQPVNVLIYNDGDRSSWHFDSVNAFTVTLMLQAPEAGGDFELVPNLRNEELDNPDGIRDVLEGKGRTPVPVAREPGALCIFRGCTALHRVSSGRKRQDVPELLTKIPTGPISDLVCSTAFAIDSGEVTSHVTAKARTPAFSIALTASIALSWSRQATAMFAPAFARPSAMPSPSPLFPPVTNAVLPSRLKRFASIRIFSLMKCLLPQTKRHSTLVSSINIRETLFQAMSTCQW